MHQFFCILHFCHTCSLCRVKLVVQFPVRVRLRCYYAFFLVYCGCDTSYIASVHIQCQASICTLSLCLGHSRQVWLAKQETLTHLGHLVSPLVSWGTQMSTVVLYCWCHSDSASVLLYFTLLILSVLRLFLTNINFTCCYPKELFLKSKGTKITENILYFLSNVT